jgi:hypothetical protein
MKWSDKKNVSMISSCHSAEVQTITMRGEEKQKPLRVIHYNQNMGDTDEKGELLQVHQVERKGMNKWFMKLFRRLLSATVLSSLII